MPRDRIGGHEWIDIVEGRGITLTEAVAAAEELLAIDARLLAKAAKMNARFRGRTPDPHCILENDRPGARVEVDATGRPRVIRIGRRRPDRG